MSLQALIGAACCPCRAKGSPGQALSSGFLGCRLSALQRSSTASRLPSVLQFRAMENKSGWFNFGGFGARAVPKEADASSGSVAQGPDDDVPDAGQQFACFGAGCFWGVELAFQRVPGVSTTEVGYTQGKVHNPTYGDVCEGTTGHSEVVRVQFDPKQVSYESLLDVFWARHDPTTLNRQVRFVPPLRLVSILKTSCYLDRPSQPCT